MPLTVVLRSEPDLASRTGKAFRAYVWTGEGVQSLHVAGETEMDARGRLLVLYPDANVTTEPTTPTACCSSCAANKPCQGGCSDHGLTVFEGGASGMAGETLLAVGEGDECAVVGCGECGGAGAPAAIQFERMKRGPKGFRLEPVGAPTDIPLELQALYSEGGSCKGGACLPWVRVQRDPARFRAALAAAHKMGAVTNSKQFYNLVKEYLVGEDQEVFLVLMLDVHANVRGIGEISRGARDRVLTPVPDVLRLPLVDGATSFVVAHNHPSGKTKPSPADDQVTQAIKRGADAVEILFVDHLVIGANGYYSYHDHGKI